MTALEGDLVVAADGVNSTLRSAYGFEPSLDVAAATYAWFGTDHVFESFTFIIAETAAGRRAGARVSVLRRASTFIVETHAACTLDKAACEELFGYRLIENRTRWINFVTVRNPFWRRDNVVLLGDAAHTAHFSIGCGTKLAMEDAISLAWAVREGDIDAYEAERRPIVESTQRAAQGSLEWFEGIGRYVHQDPEVFAFNLLTRSRRITYGELRMRDPDFVAAVSDSPPMFTPFACGRWSWPTAWWSRRWTCTRRSTGRRATSTSCTSARGRSAAPGLVMTEMICTSADGRITPGCGGLYRDEHVRGVEADRRLRARTTRRSAARSATPGARARRKLLWEGEDVPLRRGQLAADRAVADPVRGGRQPGAARDDARRHGRGARRVRRRGASGPTRRASICSRSTWRTAISCRASCRR